MESPINCDWDSCRVSMGSLPDGREDLGEIIEVMGLDVEA